MIVIEGSHHQVSRNYKTLILFKNQNKKISSARTFDSFQIKSLLTNRSLTQVRPLESIGRFDCSTPSET